MLMLGVTLSLGGAVTLAAMSQFSAQGTAGVAASSLQQSSTGKLVSMVYAAVVPGSGGCGAAYQGTTEGTTLNFALYSYGSTAFAPEVLVENASVYPLLNQTLGPGSMGVYSVSLGACAHAPGQTLLVADDQGDEFQFAS